MAKNPQVIKNENYKKLKKIVCPFCGFSGNKDDFLIEYYETILYDVSCPKCDEMIYVIPFDVDYDKSSTTNKQIKKYIRNGKESYFEDDEHLRSVWWMNEAEQLEEELLSEEIEEINEYVRNSNDPNLWEI